MSKNNSKKNNSTQIPQIIIKTGHFLEFISTKLATRYAAKLFTTPIKHKMPNREHEMDRNSIQSELFIPIIDKKIVVYEYSKSSKKVLLVHGWSGRGTQLYKIADELIKNGFSTVSFDAPAHGKSPGDSSIMVEYIESILEIDKKFGPFDAVIGHSLGGISLLNSISAGLKTNKLVSISTGNFVIDIFKDFIKNIKMKPQQVDLLRVHFENKYKETMDSLSSYNHIPKIKIPILVIHDENDEEIPVDCAYQIAQHFVNGQLFITKGQGHRKILGDGTVIDAIIKFIV